MEIYSHSRFLTLTGHHVEGTPQEIATVSEEQITTLVPVAVYDTQPPAASSRERPPENLSGMQLWERIFAHDRYGEQHLKRFQGDLSFDRGDHSLGVLRLLNTLARWTDSDPYKMRAMMLLSPLANEKWFSKRGKQDWLDYQIANAIAYTRGRK
jgi:primase-polymerase (primpol)-like protein